MGQYVGEAGVERGTRTIVIVFGSLGDLVKKIIETENRACDDLKDKSLVLEVLSLNKLLKEWPVLDGTRAAMLQAGMRHSITNLRNTEKGLEEYLKKEHLDSVTEIAFWLRRLTKDMLKYRNEIRHQMAELNKVSGCIGKASAVSMDDELVIAKEG